MKFHPESLFDTFEGENTVWTQLQAAFRDTDGDAFYRLPIVNGEGRFLFEPDIVVVLPGYAPVVIECKGCRLSDIDRINGAIWTMGPTWYRAQERPLNQARNQAIALREMLNASNASVPLVHNLVVLPFICRTDWKNRFDDLGIFGGILFADDIALPEQFATRIYKAVSSPQIPLRDWNRFAKVLGASDRWIDDSSSRRSVEQSAPTQRPHSLPSVQGSQIKEGPAITILQYSGRPPTVAEICEAVGIDGSTPHTYLVATAALERQRRADGLGGQHQLKKNLHAEATQPEEMQLLFHKAMRHFIARPMLNRTEERVLIQRAIRTLAKEDSAAAEQLRRDVFAWRDVLAEMEEEGVDLSAGGGAGILWAHPNLEQIATSLQAVYRNIRRNIGGVKPTFEESVREYLKACYVPTPIVVMEGFTRLTPLQQKFIYRCTDVPGIRLWIVLPHNSNQRAGFAALDQTYEPFLARAEKVILPTPPLGEQPSLAHLQAGLFSASAAPCTFADDGVRLQAFPHRNDEVASCVREVIRLVHDEKILAPADLVVVCSDLQATMPLLREEAELLNFPDLFALPPRQLLLTPVGRFILVLYEVWKNRTLSMDAEQLSILLASGWLGGHAQKGAELFVAVSRQHFTFCRSEPDWHSAFDRIERQMKEGDAVLGKLGDRLPSSMVTADDLATWREALDVIVKMCEQIFATGEKLIGEHIRLLLDEIERLDPLGMLQTERQVLVEIRAALAEIADGRSVAIDAGEFGEVLSGLIRERQEDQDGDITGNAFDLQSQHIWVVGPEGVDNISRHTVFFLGVDESRMPAPGSPPWPRIVWSAQEHVERQRYRFLAVVRAARQRLLISYACQDWERQYQPSPYLDEAAYLLDRTIDADSATVQAPSRQTIPVLPPTGIRRDRYTLAELASYRLCPYRFKMESLTRWAGRYTDAWQLEWLARGIWLAESFHYVASNAPGIHSPVEFRQLIENAIDAVRINVQERLPGLRQLAWTGIERQVRSNVEYLLQPSGSQNLPLRGVTIPNPRGKAREIGIGNERNVKVIAEADFQAYRGTYLNFIRDTNQSALWLIFGKSDQPISDDADEDEHLFKTLQSAVRWWRDLTFCMTRNRSSLQPDKVMELLDCIQNLEKGSFRKNPGDHCRYCPVVDTCMGLRP